VMLSQDGITERSRLHGDYEVEPHRFLPMRSMVDSAFYPDKNPNACSKSQEPSFYENY
jgi:hypothetical protein